MEMYFCLCFNEGRKISVFWERSSAWFDAKVLDMQQPKDASNKSLYLIQYDADELMEWRDLSTTLFRVFNPVDTDNNEPVCFV